MSALNAFCDSNPNAAIIYFDALLPTIGFIASISIIIATCQYCYAYGTNKLQSSKTLYWAALILFIFCFMQIIVIAIRSLAICHNINLSVIMAAVSGSAYTLQLVILTEVLFIRLYAIFKTSTYALSNKVIKAWISLSILAPLLCIMGGGLITRYSSDNYNYYVAIAIVIFGVIIFASMNIWLLITFVYKLVKVHKSIENKTDQKGNVMLNIATKCTLLCFISVFSGIIYVIVIAISGKLDNIHGWFMYFIFLTINIYCNFLGIFLSFEYFDKYYRKCCTCCHVNCLSLLSHLFPRSKEFPMANKAPTNLKIMMKRTASGSPSSIDISQDSAPAQSV